MSAQWQPPEPHRRLEVDNPAYGATFATTDTTTARRLDSMIDGAAEAFMSWRESDAERARLMKLAAGRLSAAADALAELLTREQGKPLRFAKAEVRRAAEWISYFAQLTVEDDMIRDDQAARVVVARVPRGVIAAIAAWNYPLLIAGFKIGPALRAGNTVILKPSPYTPLATIAMVDEMASCLPAGVLQVAVGGDEMGRRLASSLRIAALSLTGSTAAGQNVAAACGAALRPVTLELGGNDPALVLDDADPSVVAPRIFEAAFRNSGQVCTAVKRVYACPSVHDELIGAMAECARAAKVGDGLDPQTDLGPLTTRSQRERVARLVDEARACGGKVVIGGSRPSGRGYFYPPTIIADVSNGVSLVDDEQFGPALPIVRVEDADEAVSLANASSFGLSGSVWSRDLDTAEAVARRLECGTTWVNTHGVISPDQPFGGVKQSGLGIEGGLRGLEEFTSLQTRYKALS